MLEWRKGYPSEEMIAAHPSRLWLVKGEWWLVKKLLSLTERIERNELGLVVECTYILNKSGEIVLYDSSWAPSEGWRDIEWFNFYFYETEYIEIYKKCEYGCREHCDDLVFKGKLDGDSIKQIQTLYKSIDFISHAGTIWGLLQEKGKLQQTENQRLYAEDYFCPIDEDGNKVPWPSSVAPRGFISWVDWDASKH